MRCFFEFMAATDIGLTTLRIDRGMEEPLATNQCLHALRAVNRRPPRSGTSPGVEPPEPTRLGEIVWLEPYPDTFSRVR
jgi:hypothetical protein